MSHVSPTNEQKVRRMRCSALGVELNGVLVSPLTALIDHGTVDLDDDPLSVRAGALSQLDRRDAALGAAYVNSPPTLGANLHPPEKHKYPIYPLAYSPLSLTRTPAKNQP